MQGTGEHWSELARVFGNSTAAPDRLFSIVPTVVASSEPLAGKQVVNIGSANGDFARALMAAGAASVTAIEHSPLQIRVAEQQPVEGITYLLGDALSMRLPEADVIVAPWITDITPRVGTLRSFFERCFRALTVEGRLVLVVNLPEGHEDHPYGVRKQFLGKKEDGAPLKVDLYEGDAYVCSIASRYYAPETLVSLLQEVGFDQVTWHQPVVQVEGIERLGRVYWDGYLQRTELGYLAARKPHPKERSSYGKR